jgi:hypothetical protein
VRLRKRRAERLKLAVQGPRTGASTAIVVARLVALVTALLLLGSTSALASPPALTLSGSGGEGPSPDSTHFRAQVDATLSDGVASGSLVTEGKTGEIAGTWHVFEGSITCMVVNGNRATVGAVGTAHVQPFGPPSTEKLPGVYAQQLTVEFGWFKDGEREAEVFFGDRDFGALGVDDEGVQTEAPPKCEEPPAVTSPTELLLGVVGSQQSGSFTISPWITSPGGGDAYVSDTGEVTLSGTGQADTTVTVYEVNDQSNGWNTTVSPSGEWSATVTGLTDGLHLLAASTVDGSPVASNTVEVDVEPGMPAAVTTAASSIGSSTATLSGTVNPRDEALNACYFQYGQNLSYGSTAPCSSLPASGSVPMSESAGIAGLQAGAAYHFRIVAANAHGTTYGSDQEFATAPGSAQATFDYTGGEQTFVVPAGVWSVHVLAVGGHGGVADGSNAGGRGGSAAQVTGELSVAPGEKLYVEVGGNGGEGSELNPGGFNGGAPGGGPAFNGGGFGGGGGGASDVRSTPRSSGLSPDDRLLVAGGGGGGGEGGESSNAEHGGDGGPAGQPGQGTRYYLGGGAGTAVGGGSAGLTGVGGVEGCGSGEPGLPGALGSGGAGGHQCFELGQSGGGGGGGLYGGGGGGGTQDYAAPGGGGGSSLVPAGGTVALAAPGVEPQVQIDYSEPQAANQPQRDVATATASQGPVIASFTESHRVWREDSSARRATARNRTVPVGTTFDFVLNEQADVRLTFTRHVRGSEVDGRCVPRTGATRREPACLRPATRGTASVVGHAGQNAVVFDGAASGGQMAPPGNYTVAITATNSDGQRAITSHLHFTIVR